MKTYKTEHVRSTAMLEPELNRFGQAGWEVVNVFPMTGRWMIILEREVSQEELTHQKLMSIIDKPESKSKRKVKTNAG